MKKLLLFIFSFLLLFAVLGQIPAHYYDAAEGKKQNELKEVLSEIISNGYVQRTYSQLWADFYITDVRPDGYVWDIYSDCNFTFGTHQDHGTGGNKECDFYNREHSIPNSWFGGQQYPMYTDLFHLYPTDKYVNAQRADYPYGETNNPTNTYGNGSKKGQGTSVSGYTGTVFEPIDEYKGDLARTYFYMVTRYLNINLAQKDGGVIMFTYNTTCNLSDYSNKLLLKWHRDDPVSEKETNRNNAIYDIQHNRNPFIDFPELTEHIWGNLQDVPWNSGLTILEQHSKPSIKITKYNDGIRIEGAASNANIEIYSVLGLKVISILNNRDFISLSHLQRGVYVVKVGEFVEKVVW